MRPEGPQSADADLSVTRREILKRAAAGSMVLGAGGMLAAGASGAEARARGTTASSQPKRGGHIAVGAPGGENDQLDPHAYFTRTAFCGVAQLFEGLIQRDHKFVPHLWLAEEVTASRPDLWTIRLRAGIEFHNGKTISADDLMFTLNRIVTLPGADSVALSTIDLKGMKKLDRRTVRVPMKRPDVSLPGHLASNLNALVPVGFDPKNPVGTGPFKFASMTPDQTMSFVRNPNYWKAGLPYLDSLDVITLTLDSARVNALLGGQVQAIEGVPYAQVPVVKANPQTRVLESKTGQWNPFVMRTDVAPFNDLRVRQAMRLIANRNQLVSQGLAGHGRVANDIFSPNDPAYNTHLPQRHQDIQQAKSLLRAAGHSGLRATLTTSNIYQGLPAQAEVLVQQAKAAGVRLTIRQLDPTTFFGKQWLTYPLTQDFWTNRDYFATAGLALAAKAPYNETHWHDPQWQALYNQALRTLNHSKRTELIQECQKIEWERGGYLNWGFDNFVDGYAASVGGLKPDAVLPLGHYDFAHAYLH